METYFGFLYSIEQKKPRETKYCQSCAGKMPFEMDSND